MAPTQLRETTIGESMTVVSSKLRLAALLTGKDRVLLAGFVLDGGTDFALNPFPSATAGAARLKCAELAFEYPILGIQSAGLACLLAALAALPRSTPLTRSILKSATHTCVMFLTADGACVGAYLYGPAGVPLPVIAPRTLHRKRQAPRRTASQQLDLFLDVA